MTLCSMLVATALLAGSAEAQQPRPSLARTAEHPLSTIQGFNIVLLVGESQPSGTSIEDVPAAARRALNDMRDFLPFKHYRVLDSQWTSCCSEVGSSRIAGRVQGVSGHPQGASETKLVPRSYEFLLQVQPGASRLNVHFSLMPDGPRSGQNKMVSAAREAELEKRLSELRRELDTLEDEIPRRRERLNEKHAEIVALQGQRQRVQQRLAETANEIERSRALQGAGTESRAMIDSNFTMNAGETVVVGTSRLGGDKALIAIVTAVRKGTSGR